MTIPTYDNENANNPENSGLESHPNPPPHENPSEIDLEAGKSPGQSVAFPVGPNGVKKYSPEWWAENPNKPRCRAHRKNGNQCLRPPIRGATVCFRHGGAASQVKSAARARLENAADRMARELLQMADSAESEAVKLNAIRDALDRAGLGAKSEVTVELRPWERLLQDVTGVGWGMTRADHRAHQGALVVNVDDQPQPQPAIGDGPTHDDDDEPTHDGPTPLLHDDPATPQPPPYTVEPPDQVLVTLEEAVIMDEQHRVARGKQWR
jgi:hypothetical protein